MAIQENSDNIHPDKIFWFVVGLVLFGCGYIVSTTFWHIPKENIRFADTYQGFILGTLLTTAIGYLLVGSPGKRRDITTLPPGSTQETSTSSSSTTNTTTPTDEP